MLSHTLYSLIEDLQQKLLLYKNEAYIEKKQYFFNNEIYAKIATQVASNSYDIDLSHDDIMPIGSELWKLLLQNRKTGKKVLQKWLSCMKNTFNYSDIVNLKFENEEAKNIFLDETLEYIISASELKQSWEDTYIKLVKESRRYDSLLENQEIILPDELQKLEPNKKILDAFLWWDYRNTSNLLVLNSLGLYGKLIYFIISNEIFFYNEEKSFYRTKKLLSNCLNRPFLAGNLLAIFGNNLLISLYLSQKETLVVAMMHIRANNNLPNIQTDSIDYMTQWKELLWSQALAIFFLHFDEFINKKEVGKIVSELLILLSQNHHNQNYKAISYLTITLEYLENIQIRQSINQPKEFLLRVILEELVDKVIEKDFGNNFTFSLPYEKINLLLWLLSKVYQESLEVRSDYNTESLSSNIIEEVIRLYKSSINKALDYNGLQEDERLSKFNWALVLKLSTNSQKQEFLDVGKNLFQNIKIADDEVYSKLKTIRVHLKLMLGLYTSASKNNKLEIEKAILETVKCFAYTQNWKNDIFQAFLEQDKSTMFETLVQISNQFSDDGKEEFIGHTLKNASITNLFKLLKYTASQNRKKQILDELTKRQISEEDFTSIPEIIESLVLSLNEVDLQDYAEPLLCIFEQNQRENYYIKTLQEIKYKSTVAKIFNKKVLKINEKIKQINQVANPFNDKRNFGNPNQSMQAEIERYKRFLIGLLYFEDEPQTTYRHLKNILDESVQPSYASNMLNARYKIIEKEYKSDDKRYFEAYQKAIEEWESYSKLFSNHTLDKYEYLLLLEGYQTINDGEKFLIYWNQMPEYLQKNLEVVPIRCKFLQKQHLSHKALEYLEEVLQFHGEFDEKEKVKFENIQKELNENIEVKYLKKVEPKENFESTRLSLQNAQYYWSEIKNMLDEHHAKIFSRQDFSLEEFILENMRLISLELLERKKNIKDKDKKLYIEDMINDWVTSLINQRMNFIQWNARDQSRGGQSASEKSSGERDIIVSNQSKDDLFLIEAFRLFDHTKKIIKMHMDKLDGYNAKGCRVLIILVYCKVNDFPKLCNDYKDYLAKQQYKNFDTIDLSTHQFLNIDSSKAKLNIFKETRKRNQNNIVLYHLLCDFQ